VIPPEKFREKVRQRDPTVGKEKGVKMAMVVIVKTARLATTRLGKKTKQPITIKTKLVTITLGKTKQLITITTKLVTTRLGKTKQTTTARLETTKTTRLPTTTRLETTKLEKITVKSVTTTARPPTKLRPETTRLPKTTKLETTKLGKTRLPPKLETITRLPTAKRLPIKIRLSITTNQPATKVTFPNLLIRSESLPNGKINLGPNLLIRIVPLLHKILPNFQVGKM